MECATVKAVTDAHERPQTAAHQDEAQQKHQVVGAGEDVLDAELHHGPRHPEAARPRRPLHRPCAVAAVEDVRLRLAVPKQTRQVTVPGTERLHERGGQCEPTGNLGTRVPDLKQEPAVPLRHRGPVERSVAGMLVGGHGQAAHHETGDGLLTRAELSAVDLAVVVSVERGERAQHLSPRDPDLAAHHPSLQPVLTARDPGVMRNADPFAGQQRDDNGCGPEKGAASDRSAHARSYHEALEGAVMAPPMRCPIP